MFLRKDKVNPEMDETIRKQVRDRRNPTTSFLTATTLIYAIGAGITAAAGTRLALQLFLVKGFKVYSFRLPGLG